MSSARLQGPKGPGGGRGQQNRAVKRAPTLLEKLLAPEVRFFVLHHFFKFTLSSAHD
jgi:hypothetical protein